MNQRRSILILSLFGTLLVSLSLQSALFGNVHPDRNTPLFDINSETIDYLVLDIAGGTFPLYFVQKDNRWWLSLDQKITYPLDQRRFSAFLSVLSEKRPMFRTSVQNHSVHKTGAHAPFIVEAVYKNGTILNLFIGDTNADGAFLYVSDGETVYRITDNISGFLDGRTSAWIQHKPLLALLEKTTIQHAYISNNGDISIPAKEPLEGLQDALSGLYSIDITNIPHDPVTTMTLELGNRNTMLLYFSNLSPEFILMTEEVYNTSWIIPTESFERLLEFF